MVVEKILPTSVARIWVVRTNPPYVRPWWLYRMWLSSLAGIMAVSLPLSS